MKVLGKTISVDRSTLADTLAGPLAKLMKEEADIPITKNELKKLLLDPATNIDFPEITIENIKQSGVVVVEKVVIQKVVILTAAGRKFERLIKHEPGGGGKLQQPEKKKLQQPKKK